MNSAVEILCNCVLILLSIFNVTYGGKRNGNCVHENCLLTSKILVVLLPSPSPHIFNGSPTRLFKLSCLALLTAFQGLCSVHVYEKIVMYRVSAEGQSVIFSKSAILQTSVHLSAVEQARTNEYETSVCLFISTNAAVCRASASSQVPSSCSMNRVYM